MRTDEEVARIEAICRACPKWDAATPGCRLFKSCERKSLTRSIWRLGHCQDRLDSQPKW